MSGPETSDIPAGAETDFGFRRVPAAEKAPLVRAVFDSVAERYDVMNNLMIVGNYRWLKADRMRALRPRAAKRLVNVASDTGDVARSPLPLINPRPGGATI